MAENEDEAFPPPGHDKQPHANQGTANPAPLQVRPHANRPQPDGGRLSIDEDTKKLDMGDQRVVPVRDERQQGFMIGMQFPYDAGFFCSTEGQRIQVCNRINVF